MLPIKDNIPSRTFPVANYLIILLCTLAFLAQLADRADGRDSLVERYGLVPARVLNPSVPVITQDVVPVRTPFGTRVVRRERLMEEPGFPAWITMLTSMFLHGGWLHFLGNMWFLYIFGDNVEDRFGHFGYLLFYVVAGAGAAAFHLVTQWGSAIPTIGASGAIAGVMGAYFLLYPRARVLTVLPIFFFVQLVVLPATLFLGFWFLLQVFQGALAAGSVRAGGVAWWAHVGGFVFGVLAAHGLRRGHFLRRAPTPVHLRAGRFGRRPF